MHMLHPQNATQPRKARVRFSPTLTKSKELPTPAADMEGGFPFTRMNDVASCQGLPIEIISCLTTTCSSEQCAPGKKAADTDADDIDLSKSYDLERGTTSNHSSRSLGSLSTCSSSGSDDSGIDGRKPVTPKSPARAFLDKLETKRKTQDMGQKLSQVQPQQEPEQSGPNFCAIYLLVVALAILILVMAAKACNSHEEVYYDAEKHKNYTSSNQESLRTIQILALGLMFVLLGGSFCYCFGSLDAYTAIQEDDKCAHGCDSNRKKSSDNTKRRKQPAKRPIPNHIKTAVTPTTTK